MRDKEARAQLVAAYKSACDLARQDLVPRDEAEATYNEAREQLGLPPKSIDDC